MKPILLVLLAFGLLPTAMPQATTQTTADYMLHYVATYAGPNFSIKSYGIREYDYVVSITGPLEFRMWDIQNPSRVTLIKTKNNLSYNLRTGEVTEGNIVISSENVADQTRSNRTLTLPNPSN